MRRPADGAVLRSFGSSTASMLRRFLGRPTPDSMLRLAEFAKWARGTVLEAPEALMSPGRPWAEFPSAAEARSRGLRLLRWSRLFLFVKESTS